MSKGSLKRFVVLLLILLVAAVLINVGNNWRVFELAHFQWQMWRNAQHWSQSAIWLPDYQVQIEAKPSMMSPEGGIAPPAHEHGEQEKAPVGADPHAGHGAG